MVSTPSPSPAEAPRNLADLHDATKQTSFIEELAKSHKLTPEEKTKFTEKYKKAIAELSEKHKDKKDIVITEINEILKTFKDSLQHEKNDEDDLTDISPNTPDKDKEDTDTGKEILGDREIDEHIKQLSDKIEAKLNAPATPEKTEEVPPETQNDIQTAKKFFENKGVKLDTAPIQQGNGLRDLYKKIVLWWYGILEGFGVNVSNAKAKLEGYKDYISKQKVEETFKVLSNYMGDSVKGITEIKDKEALIDKMEGLGLPLLYGTDNLLAGPIMKLIFTGEKSAWDDLPEDFDHDIIKTIRGKYLTLQKNPKSLGGKTTLQRLNEIFTIDEDKKGEYITRYEDDQEERETKEKPETGPILGPAEAPKELEKTLSLDEVINKYDGKPYEEKKENSANDTIFVIKKANDKELSVKRDMVEEKITINPNGTLTYRGIEGKSENIIQLARLDMYVKSLDGKLALKNPNNLSENTIEKAFTPNAGQGGGKPMDVVKFSINKLPDFTPGWNWQQLYIFLLGDKDRELTPSEKTQMSGRQEMPQITQEEIDILMKRTDKGNVKGIVESANFSGEKEKDGSITINRITLDGNKIFKENIFPNPDGTFMVGNIDFPNITDAVKAANMRNWVRWHEGDNKPLYKDGNSIRIDSWGRNYHLIKDGEIPEFLKHGTGQYGKLSDIDTVYYFLKQSTIDDGLYGKNKARNAWEKTKKNNT